MNTTEKILHVMKDDCKCCEITEKLNDICNSYEIEHVYVCLMNIISFLIADSKTPFKALDGAIELMKDITIKHLKDFEKKDKE